MPYFEVLPASSGPRDASEAKCFLITDNWDDYFEFSTMYTLFVLDETGAKHYVGSVKIGEFGQTERRPRIPREFDQLDDRFFSIGQDESYYRILSELGSETRTRILRNLRDMALDQDLFEKASQERVTIISLLRDVTPASVQGQFRRMANGGARLSLYSFTYTAPLSSFQQPQYSLSFDVYPESRPPTNIHIIIGRNGVGKTRLLENMTRAIVDDTATADDAGFFDGKTDDLKDHRIFANVVSVTFSAFDSFKPPEVGHDSLKGVRYSYVGLKRLDEGPQKRRLPPRTPEELSEEFGESVKKCRSQKSKLERLTLLLEILESDPIFKDLGVSEVIESGHNEEIELTPEQLFAGLSSGHKIVLLTMVKLVELVEERTLVIMDEPEAHLHPPLLSAFVRALSDLLVERNGVAIVATHSPVVLQEVAAECVWKLSRSGSIVKTERPEIETFGENVGVLTREVFGLEVERSGFHRMILESAAKQTDYEKVVDDFAGKLGGEARSVLRAALISRNLENSRD